MIRVCIYGIENVEITVLEIKKLSTNRCNLTGKKLILIRFLSLEVFRTIKYIHIRLTTLTEVEVGYAETESIWRRLEVVEASADLDDVPIAQQHLIIS